MAILYLGMGLGKSGGSERIQATLSGPEDDLVTVRARLMDLVDASLSTAEVAQTVTRLGQELGYVTELGRDVDGELPVYLWCQEA